MDQKGCGPIRHFLHVGWSGNFFWCIWDPNRVQWTWQTLVTAHFFFKTEIDWPIPTFVQSFNPCIFLCVGEEDWNEISDIIFHCMCHCAWRFKTGNWLLIVILKVKLKCYNRCKLSRMKIRFMTLTLSTTAMTTHVIWPTPDYEQSHV